MAGTLPARGAPLQWTQASWPAAWLLSRPGGRWVHTRWVPARACQRWPACQRLLCSRCSPTASKQLVEASYPLQLSLTAIPQTHAAAINLALHPAACGLCLLAICAAPAPQTRQPPSRWSWRTTAAAVPQIRFWWHPLPSSEGSERCSLAGLAAVGCRSQRCHGFMQRPAAARVMQPPLRPTTLPPCCAPAGT